MHQSQLDSLVASIKNWHTACKTAYPSLANWNAPTFSLCPRGTTAGKAVLGKNHIIINEGLYVRNIDSMNNDTVPHELAHLAAFMLHNDRGHGKGWASVMNRLGLPATRCHSYDVSEVRNKKTFYFLRCSKCTNNGWVDTKKFNAVQSGKFGCKCGAMFKYEGVTKKV